MLENKYLTSCMLSCCHQMPSFCSWFPIPGVWEQGFSWAWLCLLFEAHIPVPVCLRSVPGASSRVLRLCHARGYCCKL